MIIGEEEFPSFSDVVFGSPNEPDAIFAEAYDLEGNLVFEIYFYANFKKEIRTFESSAIGFEDWEKMLEYVKSELIIWDEKLRKPLGTWDSRLLADPNLSYDDLMKFDGEGQ